MSTGHQLVGPISKQRKKAELQAIARALGIPDNGTAPALVLIIKAHLQQHPDLFNTLSSKASSNTGLELVENKRPVQIR
jgi:hypothetical protein